MAGLLACPVLNAFPPVDRRTVAVEYQTLMDLQLRVQLLILTGFPFHIR